MSEGSKEKVGPGGESFHYCSWNSLEYIKQKGRHLFIERTVCKNQYHFCVLFSSNCVSFFFFWEVFKFFIRLIYFKVILLVFCLLSECSLTLFLMFLFIL